MYKVTQKYLSICTYTCICLQSYSLHIYIHYINLYYVSSSRIPLMPVVYQVVGFGRGNGRHSGRHGRSAV